MLINFRVHNFRSFRDEQSLSLSPAPTPALEGSLRGDQSPTPALEGKDESRSDENGPASPLPSPFEIAAIFGANASGKTNLTQALGILPLAMRASMRALEHDEPADLRTPRDRIEDVARDPFLPFGSSSYEIDALLDGRAIRYGFAIDKRSKSAPKIEEWLMADAGESGPRWMPLISRVDRRVDLHPEMAMANGAAYPTTEQRLALEAFARRPVLLIPAAARLAIPTARELCDYLASWQILPDPTRRGGDRNDRVRLLIQDPDALPALRDILENSDVGIDDVHVGVEGPRVDAQPEIPVQPPILFRHRAGTGGARWTPLGELSTGTLALVDIALAMHAALSRGSLLVVDDFDANLHPLLVARLVSRFQHAARRDGTGAQLVITTQDAHLIDTRLIDETMGNPALRPAQIWIVERRRDGSTSLGSLGEFKMPPSDRASIHRGYLQGRFGGIPILHHRLGKP